MFNSFIHIGHLGVLFRIMLGLWAAAKPPAVAEPVLRVAANVLVGTGLGRFWTFINSSTDGESVSIFIPLLFAGFLLSAPYSLSCFCHKLKCNKDNRNIYVVFPVFIV